ncbi:MAG: 4Fe-4S binding protein [Candidatus Zipacnadales bacterium]
MADLRRQRIIQNMLLNSETIAGGFRLLDRLERAPQFVQRAVKGYITQRLKRDHFGQVIPIEDIEEIFRFVNSIVRLPCLCRYLTTGKESGYCYGLTLGPNGDRFADLLQQLGESYGQGPDTSKLQKVEPAEALEAIRTHEKEGLCHTVWTVGTPFIGGLCNCDRVDCLAMQATVQRGVKAFFRAEYVAEIDPDRCTGCRQCMTLCQFGALGFSALDHKTFVDQRACFGCGICRSICPEQAIYLRPRSEVPTVAWLW